MINFELKDFAHVSMLKSTAEEILQIIGKTLDDRGVLLIEDMHIYLQKLNNAVKEDEHYPQEIEHIDENGKIKLETRITLAQRSYPLRQLMQNAIKNNQSITYFYSKY